uniref:Rapamycin-insensitive companion of mTOR n=1 Tax=Biomphalaria glabrata TaxID=6526 RepID=A0A2C9LNG1_BIOGL
MATGSTRPVRNLKAGRYRVRHESAEDVVIKLDHNKEPCENVKEILKNLVSQNGVPSSRKTAYLNSFVKLIKHSGYSVDLGVPILDILSCLGIGLLNDAKQVRTATLRVIRYLLPYNETLDIFLHLHFDFLVARCLDVSLDNEIERIHAIKLIRQIIKTSPSKCPKSLLYVLVAIGNDGASERDRMVRVSLETICELAFYNVNLVAQCGGIQTLIWNILDCHQYPRLNEALTSVIIFLLNQPHTRPFIRPQVDLERLLAPFTDSHFRYSVEDGRNEERDSKFIASKMAVISVMRSWPGLIRLCHPDGSGMQSLIGILYLPYVEIRKYVLEVISDLFRLTLPTWSEDFATAFSSVDPCEMKDAWKLAEGFVAEEGRAILPHISPTRPNLIENHLALLLSAFFTAGLCEALIEVVITSTGPLFNRAVILLGELLHMANVLLPQECLHHHECLPTLISIASSTESGAEKRHQAYQAVMYLTRFHKMMKRKSRPCTVFLDQLLQHAGKMSEATNKHWILHRESLSHYYFKKVTGDEMTVQAIRDSKVNTTTNNTEWNWPIIAALLKWPDDKFKKLDDQNQHRFIKRLVYFFKPENDLFSKTDITDPNLRKICVVGCHLIDFLISSNSDEAEKLITELLSDIAENLKEVTKLNVPVDENAMFGSKRLQDKMCRYYFLFIGRLSATKKGTVHLEKNGIIQTLLELMSPSTNILYVKLAISCLNYAADGSTRPILSKALTATQDVCRLYATKLLRVLMRACTPGLSTWGIELLITQLYDPEKSIAMSAVNILDEACDNEEYLKSVIKLRPSLLHLGEKGIMLLTRFVSNVQGFRSLNDANFISSQLEQWHKSFNKQYVDIVEEMLNEALTTYEKSFTGSCPRRSILKGPKKDVYLPVHLYGQLTLHDEGLDVLRKQDCIKEYLQCVIEQRVSNNTEITELKTALWALGHIGMSCDGLAWLETEKIIPEIIRLAEENGVFSIRGTAFFVLGLIASTRKGTDILNQLGWESRCHTRKEIFPVLDQDGWMHGPVEEALFNSDRLASSSHQENHRISSMGSMSLSLIQEETFPRKTNPSAADLGASSVPSTKDPNQRHSSASCQYTMGTLNVSNATGYYKTSSHDSENYNKYQSLPSRSQSERGVSKTFGDIRPRAQTGDKITLRASHPSSPSKYDSVPININSITLDVTDQYTSKEPTKVRHSTSRDSIQLIASPIVKLRTSSDEDSAILDNFGSQPNDIGTLLTVECSSVSSATVNGSLHSHNGADSVSNKETSGRLSVTPDTNASKEVVSFKMGAPSLLVGKEISGTENSFRSKSRGSSFNTTDTSGVGSCDSNTLPAPGSISSTFLNNALTPIPSSSSLSTLTGTSTLKLPVEPVKEPVHHSVLQRSLFRLSRIPSAKRRSASPALGITANGGQSFTSQRDALGYAALRNIKRQRTYSAEGDGEVTLLEATSLHRTISQDSELSVESNMWLSMRRNVSSVSLQEQDVPSSPISSLNRAAFKPLSPSNRFVGITLPVDIKMIFEDTEAETLRKTSTDLDTGSASDSLKAGVPPLKKEMSFEHTTEVCIVCNRYRKKAVPSSLNTSYTISKGQDTEAVKLDQSDAVHSMFDIVRTRGGSMNDHSSSATPGSQTSGSSGHETAEKKLREDSEEGRELIRLEVMRLIVNLGSSVGLKSSETGLLSLKQRFPKCFQSICFYSEVCHLLSTYSYRLVARRFIHELFDELDLVELLAAPCQYLGLELDPSPHMAPIRQDSLDDFQDFSFA